MAEAAASTCDFEWDEASDGLGVTLNPRTWDAAELCFCRDDAFLADGDEQQVLSSPNSRRARRPPRPAAFDGAAPIDPPKVEPAVARNAEENFALEEVAVASTVDERLLQLRFFRELNDGERLQALVSLRAVSPDLRGSLDHSMQRRLFRLSIKRGQVNAVETLVAAAEVRNGEGA